jgi:hypothetical protein
MYPGARLDALSLRLWNVSLMCGRTGRGIERGIERGSERASEQRIGRKSERRSG